MRDTWGATGSCCTLLVSRPKHKRLAAIPPYGYRDVGDVNLEELCSQHEPVNPRMYNLLGSSSLGSRCSSFCRDARLPDGFRRSTAGNCCLTTADRSQVSPWITPSH